MNNTNLFLITGLILNSIGSAILLFGSLNPWKPLSDSEIKGQREEDFLTTHDIKNMQKSIVSFVLLLLGFVLQLIGTIANH